jgi:hypothetical protein
MMNWSNWWNENLQGQPKYSEKTCPSFTLSIKNSTWTDLGSNPGRRRTCCLLHALLILRTWRWRRCLPLKCRLISTGLRCNPVEGRPIHSDRLRSSGPTMLSSTRKVTDAPLSWAWRRQVPHAGDSCEHPESTVTHIWRIVAFQV